MDKSLGLRFVCQNGPADVRFSLSSLIEASADFQGRLRLFSLDSSLICFSCQVSAWVLPLSQHVPLSTLL